MYSSYRNAFVALCLSVCLVFCFVKTFDKRINKGKGNNINVALKVKEASSDDFVSFLKSKGIFVKGETGKSENFLYGFFHIKELTSKSYYRICDMQFGVCMIVQKHNDKIDVIQDFSSDYYKQQKQIDKCRHAFAKKDFIVRHEATYDCNKELFISKKYKPKTYSKKLTHGKERKHVLQYDAFNEEMERLTNELNECLYLRKAIREKEGIKMNVLIPASKYCDLKRGCPEEY